MSAPLTSTSTSAIEPFVCPRPIDASCQCAVCLHIGVTDQRLLSPPPVFHSYQIVRVGPNNEQVEASYADYEYLEKNFPKSALWTHDQASQPWHKALLKIVRTLIKDKRISYPFCQPVDVVALNIPDYYNVIRHPMDLGTIESNMTNGIYHHPEQVVNDVRLVFRNCYVYNKAEHAVTIMAREMSYNFEKALAAL